MHPLGDTSPPTALPAGETPTTRPADETPGDSDAPGSAHDIRDSLEDEAPRLLAAAQANGVPLRLLGGMGIRLLLGEHLDPRLRREIEDLDFIATRRAGAAVEELLAAHGWEPRRRFNALNGARRLLFDEPAGTRRVDVFVGGFQMCHSLPLLERMETHAQTLPAAELTLTKLQIVALNAKDRGDLYALLLGCQVADHDAGAINAQRIAALASLDWGLYHTIELNLARLREGLAETPLPTAQRELIAQRITTLADALERAPKSRSWRLRARVGERRRWYEDPEEVER